MTTSSQNKWSSELPTQDGVYWAVENGTVTAVQRITSITKYEDVTTGEMKVYYYRIGDDLPINTRYIERWQPVVEPAESDDLCWAHPNPMYEKRHALQTLL